MSLGDQDAGDGGFLSNQVSKMRKDIQKLAQRYDSMAITASATPRRERSKSPGPKVTFQDPPMEEGNRRTGPNQGRPNYGYQSQSRGGYRGFSQSRGRGRGYMLLQNMRGNGRGGFRGNYRGREGFPPQQSYMPPQGFSQYGQYPPQAQPQAAMFGGLEADQKCGKCGLALHANVLYCPAANAQCLFCGKVGHYRRCCRLTRLE